MRIHFDALDFIYPGLNQAGGVEIGGTNTKGDSLSFYLTMDKAVEFSKELAEFVAEWKDKVKSSAADKIGGRRITSVKDLVKTHGGPVQDAAIRDLEMCDICKAGRGTPCRTSNLQTRHPHPGRKSAKNG